MRFIERSDAVVKFSRLTFGAGQLYYRGFCNLSWEFVADQLAKGKFPEQIRGNFAFFWISSESYVAAVDPLSTYPIFYSRDNASPSFDRLVESLETQTKNERVIAELVFLKVFTIGSETPVNEVSRLLPGHYMKDGRQYRYISLTDYEEDERLDKREVASLLDAAIKQSMTDKNLLLLSSGTDSMTLRAAIQRAGLLKQFKFLHVHSDLHIYSEVDSVKEVAKEFNFSVLYYKAGLVEEAAQGWIDKSGAMRAFMQGGDFPAKRAGLAHYQLEDHTVFTGELGDQLFGGPKTHNILSYAIQSEKSEIDPYDMAKLYLHQCLNHGLAAVETTPLARFYLESGPVFREVYEELIEKLASIFATSKSHDLLNRILLMNLMVKGPFRLISYSQDNLAFAHPFANWDLVDFVLRLPSRHKINRGGLLKALALDLWPEYLSEELWKKPKIGARIPDKKLYQHSSPQLEI